MNAINETGSGMGTTSNSKTASSGMGSNSSFNASQTYKDIKHAATDTFGSQEEMAAQLRTGVETAQKKVKEYADVAKDFAGENPLYIALGAAGLGLIVGAYLARRR